MPRPSCTRCRTSRSRSTAGEFFGIIGRNGSGKSTLLKCLAGIYRPDRGAIAVGGRVSPFIELGVGFNPELTARDNVVVNAALLGIPTAEALARFPEIIRFAELEQFVDLKLKNYSSGHAGAARLRRRDPGGRRHLPRRRGARGRRRPLPGEVLRHVPPDEARGQDGHLRHARPRHRRAVLRPRAAAGARRGGRRSATRARSSKPTGARTSSWSSARARACRRPSAGRWGDGAARDRRRVDRGRGRDAPGDPVQGRASRTGPGSGFEREMEQPGLRGHTAKTSAASTCSSRTRCSTRSRQGRSSRGRRSSTAVTVRCPPRRRPLHGLAGGRASGRPAVRGLARGRLQRPRARRAPHGRRSSTFPHETSLVEERAARTDPADSVI